MLEDGTVPVDTGSAWCLKTMPAICAGRRRGPWRDGGDTAPRLQEREPAAVRGRGSFAAGRMLKEAFRRMSIPEASCKAPYPLRLLSPRGEKEGKTR